jgi:hypothetical protein
VSFFNFCILWKLSSCEILLCISIKSTLLTDVRKHSLTSSSSSSSSWPFFAFHRVRETVAKPAVFFIFSSVVVIYIHWLCTHISVDVAVILLFVIILFSHCFYYYRPLVLHFLSSITM